jgi:GT2 family glycosyltransferase
MTRPDPLEQHFLTARHTRTLSVDPPDSNAQTCNILYPRTVLEALDGFDERLPTPAGEDTDLAARAHEVGIELVAAPDAVVYHAVERYTFAGMLRLGWKWRHLPYLAKRHPRLRRDGRVDQFFWRDSHKRLLLAMTGGIFASRLPLAAVLALPYVMSVTTRHGRRPRALMRGMRELPAATAIDLVEMTGLAAGSIRYRTIFL